MRETNSQAEVIGLLSDPATHGAGPVERIETHASIVFLAGTRAFKLKRAVRYDYLDFSTPDLRHRFCDAELRVNGRTAAGLYTRVDPIVRTAAGGLALGGPGTPVDWTRGTWWRWPRRLPRFINRVPCGPTVGERRR